MLLFVMMHFTNHALTLVSLGAAERARYWIGSLWWNPVGTTLFYGALAVHLSLVLRSIYLRRTLRMPIHEALQIVLGLLIPLLIVQHVVGVRFSRLLYGADIDYQTVIYKLWVISPLGGLRQSVALVVIWTHACLGVFFWLRYRNWYRFASPYLLVVAILLPVLALLGFATTGRALEAIAIDAGLVGRNPQIEEQSVPREDRGIDQEAMNANLERIERTAIGVFGGMLLSVLLLRALRAWRQRSTDIEISYEGGAMVRAPRGLSLLEASRLGAVPHYAVCGGKGRCSTCRVRILSSKFPLPPPGDIEQATLRRIHADPDVRLGCQLHPEHDLKIALVLAPQEEVELPVGSGSVRPGREAEIAILFCDIRNFTMLTETRLPYDVVFLLNRYFAIVGQAVEQADGRLDKFIGDGAMALFGLDGNSENACRNALKAAANIIRNIDRLNEELSREFTLTIRVAIGIHAGPSIVGVMGYGAAKNLTAIGDTVNVASRLESVAKEYDSAIVVSEPAIVQARAERGDLQSRKIAIRGRVSEMRVYLVTEEESGRFA
ncbi:2Fe-2S iron-sulfur cluster binding domain-containing protein [Sinorhizobium sp. BG8]|nr:2Fe-2S iron-sulfur cluster binding domain-containing protein [Sinorhizobium sp. BG8]